MNDRRKFVRNFGLLGAVLSGMGVAEVGRRGFEASARAGSPGDVGSDNSPVDISHLQPNNKTTLSIYADNTPPKPITYTPSGYTVTLGQGSQAYVVKSMPNFEEQNKVNLSVGKDNRLWIEVDGKWRRVALEA